MPFYIFAGLAVVAVMFLVMLSVQLFRIEKNIGDITLLTEHRVKKIYESGKNA